MWCIVFFKQKTAYEMRMSDWSSDVCSSDLLALALTNFRRLLRNWNVREYSNPQTTLPANVARNRAASRFDLACRDTFRFQGLLAIRAEVEFSTAGCITLDPPFVGFWLLHFLLFHHFCL